SSSATAGARLVKNLWPVSFCTSLTGTAKVRQSESSPCSLGITTANTRASVAVTRAGSIVPAGAASPTLQQGFGATIRPLAPRRDKRASSRARPPRRIDRPGRDGQHPLPAGLRDDDPPLGAPQVRPGSVGASPAATGRPGGDVEVLLALADLLATVGFQFLPR